MRASYCKILVLVALLGAVACDSGRHSSKGFRLAADGNAERGQAAFVALGCHNCHRVSGAGLPQPVVQPRVPVLLGGGVDKAPTDGYLTTSIVNPDFNSDGKSRMPCLADRMTVRQLTDIVAFLQSHYTIRDAEGYPPR